MNYYLSRSLVALFILTSLHPAAFAQSPPNFLFIIADDLNDYIWAGEERTQNTPNLAQLAENASRFTACYANSPLCCPSRASMMTGKSPLSTGLSNNEYVNRFRKHFPGQTVITLPQHFKENGYYTVGINKIYHNFQRKNFDNDYDVLEPNPLLRIGSWNTFFKQPESRTTTLDRDQMGTIGYIWGRISDDQIGNLADNRAVNRALYTLQAYQSNPSAFDNRPLMLTVGMISPHVPHIVPERFFPDQYIGNLQTATSINYQTEEHPDGWPLPDYGPGGAGAVLNALPIAAQHMATQNNPHQATFEAFAAAYAHLSPLSEEELIFTRMANANMAYTAATRYFDYEVGRLLRGLDSLGLAENTVVVLVSDHGFSLGEHRHWAKNSLWETDTRVPLIIYDPRQTHARVIDEPVSLLDLYPTFCDLAGLPYPSSSGDPNYLEGHSLLLLMQGSTLARPIISTVSLTGDNRLKCQPSHSVFTRDWHYMQIPYEASGTCNTTDLELTEVLYHLSSDRLEWHNVAELPENALVMNYMQALLAQGNGSPSPDYFLDIGALNGSVVNYEDTLKLKALLRNANGDTLVSLPGGLSIQWQLNADLSLSNLGFTWNIPLGGAADSLINNRRTIRIDAYLMDDVGEQILTLASIDIYLQHDDSIDEPAGRLAIGHNPDCELSPEQQGIFYDLQGRLMERPQPFQPYLDACGQLRMILH